MKGATDFDAWLGAGRDGRRGEADTRTLLAALARAGRILSEAVARAPLAGLTGLAGRINVQGEEMARLDEYSHETVSRCLTESGVVAALVSEEAGEPVFLKGSSGPPAFSVCFDPLDGSSNIDVGVSVGTIFSVFRHDVPPERTEDLLRPGTQQHLAGYVIYGSCTTLVVAVDGEVNGFTLDPRSGRYMLSHARLKIPKQGKIYSANESNAAKWHAGLRRYVDHLKTPGAGRSYTARYVGSLVADFHRNLLRGGIFLYPADAEDPKQSGKLRLMYEANPLALVVESAGGAATTGRQRILDVRPGTLHQRVPLIIGSADDVRTAGEFLDAR